MPHPDELQSSNKLPSADFELRKNAVPLSKMNWDSCISTGLGLSWPNDQSRLTFATEVEVYFCDPQSPWQRGPIENTNWLLRKNFLRG